MSAQRQGAPSAPPMMQPHRGEGGAVPSEPAAAGPAREVEVSLTYLNLMNQFHRLDEQEQFTAAATRLYAKLVDRCSRLFWKNPFKQANPYLAAICGNWSVNTLKKHREELERRGLVYFQPGGNGAGNMGTYRLLIGAVEMAAGIRAYEAAAAAKAAAALAEAEQNKVSESDTLFDTMPEGETEPETGKVSDKVSGKVSDKVSTFDTNKRRKAKDKDLNKSGGSAPLEKKIELDFSAPAIQAPAPQTGGGAGGGRVIPMPQPEGETAPAFVDPRLTDDDPRKWVGRPRDVEMVAEFYRTHPYAEQQAKAPRAHIFFNHYKGQDWKKGNGLRITDWRSVAEGYKCLENYGSSTNPAGGAGASQQPDRYKTASRGGGFGSFKQRGPAPKE